MIELEVQVLAHTREGLLVEIGRVAAAHGFVLQRQRLAMDRHGALLTLIVAGAPRRQRGLDNALSEHERVISHVIAPFEGGEMHEHFAASRAVDTSGYVPAPPVAAVPVEPAAAAPVAAAAAVSPPASTPPPAPVTPLPAFDPEEFLLPLEAIVSPAAPARTTDEPLQRPVERLASQTHAPAPPPADPFVEIVPLPADEAAIEHLLGDAAELSDALVTVLLQLDRTVAPGAREPTLQRAGQRLGATLARRDVSAAPMTLTEAIERVGLPTLRALVNTDMQGSQLHLRNSPLCAQAGHSGCAFFTGLLEGALAPHVAAHEVSVFNVCCRAWGADECVLAISD